MPFVELLHFAAESCLRGPHGDALRSALEQDPQALPRLLERLKAALFWAAARAMAWRRGMLPSPLDLAPRSGLWSALRREALALRGQQAAQALPELDFPEEALRSALLHERWRDAPVELLGEAHETLLNLHIKLEPGPGRLLLKPGPARRRKSHGSYYTRPSLRDALLEGALVPLLERGTGARGLPTVCDPSCGAGNLLVGAARLLASRGARGGAVERLHGVDVDPAAVELCRMALWLEGGYRGVWPRHLEEGIRCGDSLQLRWPEAFPEVFARGGFDCVVGNPPFVNCIEGPQDERRASWRSRAPEFGGTADLAYLMLGASLRLLNRGGRVGMIQPRTLLNARPAEQFRRAPPCDFRLVEVRVPESASLFPGATVFVCLVYLDRSEGTAVRVTMEGVDGVGLRQGEGPFEGSNWWSEALRVVQARAAGEQAAGPRLGERFEVEASMTAGEAYEARAFLVDDEGGAGFKLLTTGLIDPGRSFWGKQRCRYLKHDYQHPRLREAPGLSKSLRRRLERAARPKIVVAGLSRVVECYLDRHGEHLGAVSTYSIFDPHDRPEQLEALANHLHSPEVSRLFHSQLGGNALGGGNTTMTKSFLKSLVLPAGGEDEGQEE